MERQTSNRTWKWLAVPGIMLVAIVVYAKVRSLRNDTKITGCWARLHEVAFTVSKYNQKHGHLPPRVVYKDGVAMHSWRVLILEEWEPQLFAQYRLSERWNSPHNSLLANQMPDRYRCPLDRSSLPTDQTTYVAVADSRAVLRTNTDGTLRQEDVPPDSIMLIEFSSKPRHWMSPEDASPEEIIAYIQSMQTDPTCHMRYSTADVRTRPIRELDEKTLPARLRSEMAPTPQTE
jgi:hypothetical protein